MNNGTRGFTLIELLVVVAIIGMLSSIVLSSLNTARANSRDAKRLQDAQSLQNALELYALANNGGYPLAANWVGSWQGEGWLPGLGSQYIQKVPLDPVNSDSGLQLYYYYISNGVAYCLNIPQEKDCSNNPYYRGYEAGTCKLGFGEYPSC